ncbi:MAG: hypothetical protein HYZ63_04100 [Candidatus Andersenbacteria bacterium]|nr:hypothetical protein [Candidatus Andersenbacteria bacterium]
MDISLLKYPKKSHRKKIILPSESVALAELMGIILGDGGINNGWQLIVTVNSIADLAYSGYVKSLLENLFGIQVVTRKKKIGNALDIISSSTSLVDFVVSKGAVRGNKVAQKIDIPNWIKGNEEYEKHCVRGLVDTDGCLYIHRHTVAGKKYRNIGFNFSSMSKPLIYSVSIILKKFDIEPHITPDYSQIYLYSQKAVVDYLGIFGSSNPRITNKYKEWRGA